MSPLARAATLAAMALGGLALAAGPAAAESATPAPTSTATPAATPTATATPNATSTPTPSPTATSTATSTPTTSAQDTQYLQQAHQTNLAEIAAGKMAQQKGNSQIVKNLGTKFVTDHTNLDKKLVPVAQQLHVKLPSAPNPTQQAVANQLKNVSGSQFDTLFVQSQFAGHTQAMQAGQTEIATGTNPKAVNVAKQAAPVLESHHKALLAAAQALGIPLTSAAPSASGSPMPTMPAMPSTPATPTSPAKPATPTSPATPTTPATPVPSGSAAPTTAAPQSPESPQQSTHS